MTCARSFSSLQQFCLYILLFDELLQLLVGRLNRRTGRQVDRPKYSRLSSLKKSIVFQNKSLELVSNSFRPPDFWFDCYQRKPSTKKICRAGAFPTHVCVDGKNRQVFFSRRLWRQGADLPSRSPVARGNGTPAVSGPLHVAESHTTLPLLYDNLRLHFGWPAYVTSPRDRFLLLVPARDVFRSLMIINGN